MVAPQSSSIKLFTSSQLRPDIDTTILFDACTGLSLHVSQARQRVLVLDFWPKIFHAGVVYPRKSVVNARCHSSTSAHICLSLRLSTRSHRSISLVKASSASCCALPAKGGCHLCQRHLVYRGSSRAQRLGLDGERMLASTLSERSKGQGRFHDPPAANLV